MRLIIKVIYHFRRCIITDFENHTLDKSHQVLKRNPSCCYNRGVGEGVEMVGGWSNYRLI